MLRVGYPATLMHELLRDFPEGIELIPISAKLDHDVEIDVWIPDPYSNVAIRSWPHLRGVKLVLSMMAGTEWIPPLVGPHVTICNAHGAHNVATAEWTVAAILAMLKYFPLYLDIQHSGTWKRRFEAGAHYAKITGDSRTHYPPVLLEELTGKTVLLIGYGSIGKDIERMLAPYRVEMVRVARNARTGPLVHPVGELNALIPQADVIVLILPNTAESKGMIGRQQFVLMKQGALLVNAARGPIVDTDALVEALQCGKNSRCPRCHRPRAAAGGPSAMGLPQPAYHAARRRIEPAVCPQRSAHSRRRNSPLHEWRAAAQHCSSSGLKCGGASPIAQPQHSQQHQAGVEQRGRTQIFVKILADINNVDGDP